ncbi:MAG: FAD-binding protein [Pseudomonadota bacterium]
MSGLSRRALLLGGSAAIGGVAAHHLSPGLPSYDGVTWIKPVGGEGLLNDASGLSETPVHKHIIIEKQSDAALVDAIRAEIKSAKAEGRAVNIGAARHSMGGQAIPREGHAITYQGGFVEPDTSTGTYRTHAGTRWSEVIGALDPIGFGPQIMQSNHDFGVAATFCVNAHGWPVKHGPMGSGVQSFNMVLPDGELVRCSRSENTDLFNQTMGGYGLTGAITEMVVEMLPNQRLQPSFEAFEAKDYGTRFIDALNDPAVTMAYGRLNVERESFFEKALMITYRPTVDQSDLPPASGSGTMAHIASRIYRWQLGNEPMKSLRWWFETGLGPSIGGGPATRNSLMNEPVVTLDDRNPDRTDILHEYFVAPERFAEFIDLCRAIIPGSFQEFLNVTLRFVDKDAESWLSYATVPRIAAVMSFSQEMTARAEADMLRMTQALIDGVIQLGGTYYLPYRPHANVRQMAQAYPRAAEFAAAKRALDPDLTFGNNLWDTYLSTL